jgi:hypothetical protein
LIPAYAFERGNIMKGIFALTLALCLGACASQPAQTAATDQPVAQSIEQTQPSNEANVRSSDRVYVDQYNLVPYQAHPQRRGIRVLGTKKDSGSPW